MNTRTFILYLSAMLMCAAMGCAKDDAMRMEQMEAGEDGTHEGVLGSGTGSMNLTGESVDTSGGTGFAPESYLPAASKRIQAPFRTPLAAKKAAVVSRSKAFARASSYNISASTAQSCSEIWVQWRPTPLQNLGPK